MQGFTTIRSDNGREFVSELHEQLYRITGSRHLLSLPYCPRMNSSERCHKEIHAILSKTIQRHSDWSSHLDYIASCFNKTVHRSTGFTPEFLTFGRSLPSNLSALLGSPGEESPDNYGEFAEKVVQRLSHAYSLTQECLKQKAVASKRYFDRHVKEKCFNPGDRVLVYSHRVPRKAYAKWQRVYAQECEIIQKVNDVIYILQTTGSKKRRIIAHVDKLKLIPRKGEESIQN